VTATAKRGRPPGPPRQKKLLSLSPEAVDHLERLADREDVTQSQIVESLLDEAWKAGETRPEEKVRSST
jgi:hypothetical protein